MPRKRISENVFSSKNSERKRTRVYSVSYLKLGFVPDSTDETKPYCLLCCKSLCNDSMRNQKLEDHVKNVHSEHAGKPLEYFQRLNEHRQKNRQMSLTSMFKVQTNLNMRGVQASYELSFLLAKKSRPHIDGEELLKPACEIYHRTMLDSGTPGPQLAALPLSNDTVRRRIDKIAIDVQSQLNDILRNTKFSLALDESTVRDSEALLLGYARFKHDSNFAEEMLFCKSLKTTITARDIYAVVQEYFTENGIPIKNLISTAADGAPAMMGRHKGVLKLLKDDNPRRKKEEHSTFVSAETFEQNSHTFLLDFLY
ncbi:SCAN domain-containing protein 3-like [Clavelina lepadiformis]|uniref:SCAN domain-containing protein 3-like n=1 Tax=Clavelina lepadiformis TaxID=159417 RepID=UPI0040422E82